MAKVSDKAVGRSKGGNLLPGGSITGNLDEIVNSINDSIKNVEAGIDLIFNGNVDSQKSFFEFIDAFNKTRSQASEELMSMMGFVSGGQSISENTRYDNIKTDIQSFTKSISENLDKTNKILTSDGMQVIVTNFNEQKLEKEKYKSNNTNNQINPVDLNSLNIKIDDLNFGEDSLEALKNLSDALNSVAKVKYEVKDQNIVQYLTGIDKSISKIDIDNLKKKISKVNKLLTNDFLKLCNAINSASIDSKKTMSQLSSVVELMNAIPSIGEMDKQKMKTL